MYKGVLPVRQVSLKKIDSNSMKKLISFTLLFGLLWLGCGNEDDPYLNNDEELRIVLRSLVVHSDYQLLNNRALNYGVPYEMYNVTFKEGGNLAEISVRFSGGCGEHRFGLYAEQTYEGIANMDAPIDVILYFYHWQVEEECSSPQDLVLRPVDLSFLAKGRYNLTIENTTDRNSFRVQDYEIQ